LSAERLKRKKKKTRTSNNSKHSRVNGGWKRGQAKGDDFAGKEPLRDRDGNVRKRKEQAVRLRKAD